jgi:hypothetical protein
MSDDAKKNEQADAISEDDLEQVAGGLGEGFGGMLGEAMAGEA